MNVLELEPLRSIKTTIGSLYGVYGDPDAAYRGIENEWFEKERMSGEITDLVARLSMDGDKVIELTNQESSLHSPAA